MVNGIYNGWRMEEPGSRMGRSMTRKPPRLAVAALLMIALLADETAHAQKPGGVLQVAHRDSPASMSPLEEGTISTVAPVMAGFNNLVMFDQHVPQNTLQSIVPDLATGWSWNEDGTALTFRLREGVRWHTDTRLPQRTCSALGICCSASRRRSFASTRGSRGTGTWTV